MFASTYLVENSKRSLDGHVVVWTRQSEPGVKDFDLKKYIYIWRQYKNKLTGFKVITNLNLSMYL